MTHRSVLALTLGAVFLAAPGAFAGVDAPTIVASVEPAPNEAGWNAGPVTVTFTCADDDVVVACSSPVEVTTSGAGQIVTGTVEDNDGNIVETSVTVNIDTSAPVVTATRDRQPNAFGWNRADVTVTWTCTDDQPGATLSEETFTFSTEGAALSHTATCTDIAGNETPNTQTARIDKTAPMTQIEQHTGGDVRGTATDALSGVTGTKVTWTNVGTVQTAAVCYSGCVSGLARWRATPPRPWPNVYRIGARSTDLAGNEGPSATAAPIIVIVP